MPVINSVIVTPVQPGQPIDPDDPHYVPNPPDPPPALVPEAAITPFLDDLPIPPVVDLRDQGRHVALHVVLRRKIVKLHRNLPETPVWSYDVHRDGGWIADRRYLGPTLMVNRRQRLTVTYEDLVGGALPVTARRRDLTGIADPNKAAAEDVRTANATGRQNADTPADQVAGSGSLYAAAVVHLHGGRTAAMYDGWTENTMLPPRDEEGTDEHGQTTVTRRPGETQVSVYENDQRAAMLWYHDHLMGATRYMVHAGLAGAYLIRDPEDPGADLPKALSVKTVMDVKLPAGPYEIPLVIQDRNLDGIADPASPAASPTTLLNGRLLHKVTSATAEFFGPYTLVNGVIWPRMVTERRRYRLRLLNGSNARTYCLKLGAVTLDASGTPSIARQLPMEQFVRQIGTDGGLLAAPVQLPVGVLPPGVAAGTPVTDGLLLAPAERADLIVDFSLLPDDVTQVAFVNTAFAPFHQFTVDHPDPNGLEQDPLTQAAVPTTLKPGDAVEGMRLTRPWVMCFDLTAASGEDETTSMIPPDGEALPVLADPDTLGPSTHGDLVPDMAGNEHGHRIIALVEYPPGMLMNFELAEFTPGQLGQFTPTAVSGVIAINEAAPDAPPATKFYSPIAARFEDRVGFYIPYGKLEVWKILNLTTDTHPLHVHLVQFKVLSRTQFDKSGFDPGLGSTAMGKPITNSGPGILDDNEKGWKDTVRVNPGEMVSIAARFDGFCGRYMYHCHILEHEDHDMMRPFIVMPTETMTLMPDVPMLDGTPGDMNGMNMNGMP